MPLPALSLVAVPGRRRLTLDVAREVMPSPNSVQFRLARAAE